MKAEDFEALYRQVRQRAVQIARGICGGEAEDAVQETATYFWERLDATPRITPSLFFQRVAQRARDRVRPSAGRVKYESTRGLGNDLEEVERMSMPVRGRRNSPHPPAE